MIAHSSTGRVGAIVVLGWELLRKSVSAVVPAVVSRLVSSWVRERVRDGQPLSPGDPRGLRPRLSSEKPVCIGRSAEIRKIKKFTRDLNGGAGIFNIYGDPATGKTALANHVADGLVKAGYTSARTSLGGDARHNHRPGTLDATLEALTTLLNELGVTDTGAGDLDALRKRWRDRTAETVPRKLVLVIDDWHAGVQLSDLVPDSRDVLMLVTSRNEVPQKVDGCRKAPPLRLGGLKKSAIREVYLTALGESTFRRRREARRLSRAKVDRPLAIKLMAGAAQASPPSSTKKPSTKEPSTKKLSVKEMRVKEMVRSLGGDPSVQNVFAQVYAGLPKPLRMVMRGFSLHPGAGTRTLTVGAAAALAGIPDADADAKARADAMARLEELCLRGFIDRVPAADGGGETRYQIHEQIRLLVLKRAEKEPPEVIRKVREHGWRYYEKTAIAKVAADVGTKRWVTRHDRANDAAASNPTGLVVPPGTLDGVDRRRAEAAAWYARERANLLAYLTFAQESGEDVCLVRLTDALHGLLRNSGPWRMAEMLHNQAAMAALRLSKKATKDAEKAGYKLHAAVAFNDCGIIRRLLGRDYWGRAITSITTAYACYAELDTDPALADASNLGRANARNELGIVMNERVRDEMTPEMTRPVPRRFADDLKQADEYLREAYDRYGVGPSADGIGRPNAAKNLGVTNYLLGRIGQEGAFEKSERFFAEARAGYEKIDDHLGLAEVANWRGRLLLGSSDEDVEKARKELANALRLAQETHSVLEEARAHEGLGECWERMSELADTSAARRNARRKARDEYENALRCYRSVGSVTAEQDLPFKLEKLKD